MFTELLANWGEGVLNLMEGAGYFGLFWLSFLDRAAMNFVPAELILPLAGFLIARGEFSLWVVLLVSAAGGLLGDLLIYGLSAKYGRWLVERYGRYFFLSRHELEHVDKMFVKYGGKLVFIGRFMPVVRAFTSIPAGLSRMPIRKFSLYTFLGSFPGNFPFVYVGLKAGENWPALQPVIRNMNWLAIGVVGVSIFWYIYQHIKRKHATH